MFCLLLQLLGGAVAAQRWAIQTFAFNDERQAEAVVTRLRSFGFDAYPSSAKGSTLVQVRIGCFSDQPDADALAQDVRQRVAFDALVVPFAEGDGATVCVTRQLGFIPPSRWGVAEQTATSVSFWLEAAGRRSITFDGEYWQLEQGKQVYGATFESLDTLLETNVPAGLGAYFRATQSRGLPLVRADLGGGSLLITAGKLLWASAEAAVVQEGSDVFALRLYKP